MATFFGEVVLPSSRAFFDDFDDDEIDASITDSIKPELSLSKYQEISPSKYDSFIISDGKVAKGFIQLYMKNKNDKLLAEVKVVKDDSQDSSDILVLKPKRVESTKLYLLSNNCLLLDVSDNIGLLMSNQLTLLLEPWLKNSEKVISVVSRHISNYRCDSVNELPPAFVRGLTTSRLPLPQALKRLEQPNFISNVPASVLTWCEGQQKAGLLLVLYSDQEVLEELTVAPLLKMFVEAGLSHFLLNKPSSHMLNDSLQNMERTFMYM